jgi:hypothetical protein
MPKAAQRAAEENRAEEFHGAVDIFRRFCGAPKYF